jgi:hypothetical protein
VTQTVSLFQVPKQWKAFVVMNEGPINISVINTKTKIVTRAPLISFVSYASKSLPAISVNTNFNFTILTTEGSTCSIAGTWVSFLILQRALLTAQVLHGFGLELQLIRLMGVVLIWLCQLQTPRRQIQPYT